MCLEHPQPDVILLLLHMTPIVYLVELGETCIPAKTYDEALEHLHLTFRQSRPTFSATHAFVAQT